MLYAEKAMYEAFRRTKLFFFRPFSLRKLLDLSLVGLLGGVLHQAGGSCGSGYNGGNSSSGWGSSDNVSEGLRQTVDYLGTFYKDHTVLIYGLIAFAILILTAISLLVSYIRANMFFVFMESLIQRHVSIIKSFTGNKNKGFSLFLFNILLGIVLFVLTIIIFIPLFLHIWHIIDNPKADFAVWTIIPNFILSFVAFVILVIISSVIYSLIYDFACPISYVRDMGISGSIVFLVRLILNYPFQFLIYYALKTAFAVAGAFLSLILFIIVLIVLAVVYIPLILIAAGIGIAIVFFFMKNVIIGIITGIIGSLLIFCIIMAVSYVFLVPFIPIHAFFRFYALCFLENFPETGLDFSECYHEDFVSQ